MANDWSRAAVLASGRSSFGDDDDSDFGGLFSSIKKAVKGAGNVVKSVGKVSTSIGAKISKVPVVGKGLHAVYTFGPAGIINSAARVAKGDRLDKVFVGHFKAKLDAARDLAPYVQTIVSFVPGVGQGVSGAIGAGVALSRGRPITEALIAGARGALPGGPVSAAAFDVAIAAAQGKPISEVALQAIPLPPDQKKLVVQAAMAAKDIAAGKNVAASVYSRGQALLPPEAQKAMQVAVAMGTAKNLQDAMKKGAATAAPALLEVGVKTIKKDPVLKAGMASFKGQPQVQKGFAVGSGIAKFKFSPTELNGVRGRLAPEVKKGFDIAMSAHIGKVLSPNVPKNIKPAVRFGFYAERGLKSAKPKNRVAMEETLVKNPEVRRGAAIALKVNKAELTLPTRTFWQKVVDFFRS